VFKVHRWTKATSRKPRCLSSGSYSLYLQLKPTIWAQSYPRKCINCATPHQERHFPAPLHHAEKSSCIETDKSYLCKVPYYRQIVMLIGRPNEWAAAYCSYWKYPTER